MRDEDDDRPRLDKLMGFVKRVGEKAPRTTKELGSLKLRLVQAGYRRDEAMTIFFGIRIVFALALFALFAGSVFMKPNITLALGGLGVGYVLPGMVLARMAKRRAHRIRLALADALDLLVVSVEAGLGLDQALTRVGHELAFAYPELSDELRLVHLELRAGKPRPEALRNLADRTGVDDLGSLVTMLIQTDKFGTSVAPGAARVFGDPPDQAPAARRRGCGQDRREDGLPARVLHFPGDLGRDDWSGGDQVHPGTFADGGWHQIGFNGIKRGFDCAQRRYGVGSFLNRWRSRIRGRPERSACSTAPGSSRAKVCGSCRAAASTPAGRASRSTSSPSTTRAWSSTASRT